MALDYGFDKTGGFYVLDHERRRAHYCYANSCGAANAKKNPAKVAAVAEKFFSGYEGDPAIVDTHYLRVCEASGVDPMLADLCATLGGVDINEVFDRR